MLNAPSCHTYVANSHASCTKSFVGILVVISSLEEYFIYQIPKAQMLTASRRRPFALITLELKYDVSIQYA